MQSARRVCWAFGIGLVLGGSPLLVTWGCGSSDTSAGQAGAGGGTAGAGAQAGAGATGGGGPDARDVATEQAALTCTELCSSSGISFCSQIFGFAPLYGSKCLAGCQQLLNGNPSCAVAMQLALQAAASYGCHCSDGSTEPNACYGADEALRACSQSTTMDGSSGPG
jgi:hypothetical protein